MGVKKKLCSHPVCLQKWGRGREDTVSDQTVPAGWAYNHGCSFFLSRGCYTWPLHNTPAWMVLGRWPLGQAARCVCLGLSSIPAVKQCTWELAVPPSMLSDSLVCLVCGRDPGFTPAVRKGARGGKLLRYFNRVLWWAPVTPSLQGRGQRLQSQGQAGLQSETLSQTNKDLKCNPVDMKWNLKGHCPAMWSTRKGVAKKPLWYL